MELSPDSLILFKWNFITINGTIAFTWGVMAFLVIGSWLITRRITSSTNIPRFQNLLEVIVSGILQQIEEITHQKPRKFIAFIGTIFLFILFSNVLAIIPGFKSPASSLSTTAALAICVFFAVPFFGIREGGIKEYLKHYVSPSFVMLPFHIIGEFSRTIALAVRLFGNIMSDELAVAIVLVVIPLVFPIFMHLLGLLTGIIQAYIFAVLAMVYIASGTSAHYKPEEAKNDKNKKINKQEEKGK